MALSSLIRRRLLLLGGRGFGFGQHSCIRSLATQQQPSQPQNPSIPPLLMVSTDAGDSRYLYNISKDEKHNLFNLYPHQHDLIINRQTNPGSHIIGSCHGFLICASSSGEDMRAFNPLTGASLHLPPAPAHFDIKNSKVVLSPSLDKAVLLHTRCDEGKAEFTRLPFSTSWIPLLIPKTVWEPTNCIFHKGHIYVVNYAGNFYIFNDNPSAASPPLVWLSEECLPTRYTWPLKNPSDYILVESPDGDDLYCLFHFYNEFFKVGKLDKHNDVWNEVQSVGDLAIFVGRDNAISLRATDFPLLEPNAIYFNNICNQDNSNLLHRLPSTIYESGVFHLKDGSIQLFNVSSKHGKILDFPPPVWFKPAVASF